ncbi:MAG: efflux RND transporter permease subunit [Planctomycetes bacterium]|nr:efflux RND transporter permease subunit [Planctomycetota bacterium]
MIARLIDWCIHNRMMAAILIAAVAVAGLWSMQRIKVDAIPDLSDVQVIIKTDYEGQSPRIIEDQVTYPLARAMAGVPGSKVIRGYSLFGVSFVYIIFDDGTDMYWARSRVLERMSYVQGQLPKGVSPQIGPDATGVGWIYEYVLTTGSYCPNHPNGLWHDPESGKWFDRLPNDQNIRDRLVRHRVFDEKTKTCPLDGQTLKASEQDLAGLRGLQDWRLRYELTALGGVSEVASIGGFEKQYQVVVDPIKLLAYKMPLERLREAIEKSNINVGGRVIEIGEREYVVQGLGYLGTLGDEELSRAKREGKTLDEMRTAKVLADLRDIPLGSSPEGTPVRLADLADVRLGPQMRRGVLDWNGQGEAVGGIVVMRFGQNAATTIGAVRQRLAELEENLPPGVAIEIGYDRSDLISRAIATLSHELIQQIIIVSLTILLFLLHARSSLVAAVVLPVGVLVSLAVMHLLGINANIMSLGGIAIAIGVMVDSSIVMVENAHKHLEREKLRLAEGLAPTPRAELIAEAAKEVGPSLFFSLLVITVSFLPILVLGEQSGRLFRPLAYTKTFSMAAAAVLAVTILPVLMVYFISERAVFERPGRKEIAWTAALILAPALLLMAVPLGSLADYRIWLAGGWALLAAIIILPQRIFSEQRNPISRFLQRAYDGPFWFAMRRSWLIVATAVLLVVVTAWPFSRLGSEFMPPLEEGDLLYMPTTDPGISMAKARELLQQTDRFIMRAPEVKSVLGKAGRAETATDPAPVSMIETTITLKRDKSAWRHVPVERFYSDWPGFLQWLPRQIWPDIRPITTGELVYGFELPGAGHVPGLNEILQIPGLTNSWTMPIRTRIDMLSTGIKTPIGVKVMGPDLQTLSDLSERVVQVLKSDAATGPYTTSVFGEKTFGGSYLDIEPIRSELSRYDLSVNDVQDVINTALGGMDATTTIEGLQRYTVNVRYNQELRDSVAALKQTLVASPAGAQVPLGQLVSFHIRPGPDMIRSENARPSNWVYVDVAGIDLVAYVRNAKTAVSRSVSLPPGYSIIWSGQYEYIEAARPQLIAAGALAIMIIILLLYMATKSWFRIAVICLGWPFSMVGAVWLLYLLDYNLSLAVWVGLIALAGLDAETGLVMLMYLDNSIERFRREGRLKNIRDLRDAIHDGAVKRIRPKAMTVATTFVGLLPLMWADGAGADTMRRLAAPMIGGLFTSFTMELLVYPAIYYLVRRRQIAGQESS